MVIVSVWRVMTLLQEEMSSARRGKLQLWNDVSAPKYHGGKTRVRY